MLVKKEDSHKKLEKEEERISRERGNGREGEAKRIKVSRYRKHGKEENGQKVKFREKGQRKRK